jgi:hypothetical protein
MSIVEDVFLESQHGSDHAEHQGGGCVRALDGGGGAGGERRGGGGSDGRARAAAASGRTGGGAGAGASCGGSRASRRAGAGSSRGRGGSGGSRQSGGGRLGCAGGRAGGAGRRGLRRARHGDGSVELDALPGATVVGVGVGRGGVGVLDANRLDVHGVRSRGVVGQATGPFDSTLGVAGVAACPGAESQAHRSLREPSATLSVVVFKGTHDRAVDRPGNGLRGPVDSVGVESALGIGKGRKGASVICGGIAFTEVVELNLGGITANYFLRLVSSVERETR